MSIRTRYRIDDSPVDEIRSFPQLSEIPYFLRHHRRRLRSIGDMVVIVSNRRHKNPTFFHLSAFHRHQTPYAAIDALAPAMAEFFERTDILPMIDPILERYKEHIEELRPRLYISFSERGILIPEGSIHEN